MNNCPSNPCAHEVLLNQQAMDYESDIQFAGAEHDALVFEMKGVEDNLFETQEFAAQELETLEKNVSYLLSYNEYLLEQLIRSKEKHYALLTSLKLASSIKPDQLLLALEHVITTSGQGIKSTQ